MSTNKPNPNRSHDCMDETLQTNPSGTLRNKPARTFVGVLVIFGIILIHLCFGCSPPPTKSDSKTVTFSQVYQEVIKASCAFKSCHGGGAGGLNLVEGNAYDALLKKESFNEKGQTLVVPKAARLSLFLKVLKQKVGKIRRMPPTEPLPQDKIEIVEKWISQGAKKE